MYCCDLLPCFRTKLSMICAKERGRRSVLGYEAGDNSEGKGGHFCRRRTPTPQSFDGVRIQRDGICTPVRRAFIKLGARRNSQHQWLTKLKTFISLSRKDFQADINS